MSWVLNPDRVGRFHRLAGSEFKTARAMKLNERSAKKKKKKKKSNYVAEYLKASLFRIGGRVMLAMCREKLKVKRGT